MDAGRNYSIVRSNNGTYPLLSVSSFAVIFIFFFFKKVIVLKFYVFEIVKNFCKRFPYIEYFLNYMRVLTKETKLVAERNGWIRTLGSCIC